MRTLSQTVCNTTTLVVPKLPPLHHVCAAVRINADPAGGKPIVILCALCKSCRQKPNLACHHAICNEKYHDCVFLLPLVLIDHLLPTKHPLCANLDLHSAGLVVDATATPVACDHPNNVNHCMNHPRNNNVTVWHNHWHQRPCNSSSHPRAWCCRRCSCNHGRHRCCSCGHERTGGQGDNTSLLTMICCCCPCHCSRRSASHSSMANQALCPEHDAGARLTALIGVGAGATLPCNNRGRRHSKTNLLQV